MWPLLLKRIRIWTAGGRFSRRVGSFEAVRIAGLPDWLRDARYFGQVLFAPASFGYQTFLLFDIGWMPPNVSLIFELISRFLFDFLLQIVGEIIEISEGDDSQFIQLRFSLPFALLIDAKS